MFFVRPNTEKLYLARINLGVRPNHLIREKEFVRKFKTKTKFYGDFLTT